VAAALAAAEDPEGAALDEVRAAIDALPEVEGVTIALVGPRLVQDALAEIVPKSVRKALVGMTFILLLLVGSLRRRLGRAVLAAAVPGATLAVVFGAFGVLGIPLHVPAVLAGLTGAAWAGWLVAARAAGGIPQVGSHLIMAVAAAAWGVGLWDAGAVLAPNLAVGIGSAVGVVVGPWVESDRDEPAVERRSWQWLPYAAAFVVLGSVHLTRDLPVGVDAGGLVSYSHPVGATSAALASATGTSPAAFVVFRGPARAAAAPAALRSLRLVQDSLQVEPAVWGSASWADFLGTLHGILAGSGAGELPDSSALVDQYLLTFGQAEELAAFRSPDLSLATATIRLYPRGAAHLGRLAGAWPADDGASIALAGRATAISLAGRTGAKRMIRAGTWAFLLVAALLLGLPSVSTLRELLGEGMLVAATASVVLIIGGAGIVGAITPSVVAGALMAGGFLAAGRSLPLASVAAGSAVLLGLFPAGPVGATQIAAFVAGLAAAAVGMVVARACEP
jgi:hypothetical protein